MKSLHRPNLFGWSTFDCSRNIDFNSVVWTTRNANGDRANVVIDPLPLSEHDWAHLQTLGGVTTIVVTNSDHVRDAKVLRERTGATLYGPAAERHTFPISCDAWLSNGERLMDGLAVYELSGSKTQGELALLIDGETLVTGDLIRSHAGGRLDILPPAKLKDPSEALRSVRQLLSIGTLQAVLPGDGWPVFRDAPLLLGELISRLELDAGFCAPKTQP